MAEALDIMGRDWAAHPLNLAHREGVKRAVADPSSRNAPTPIPTPEERRAKELHRAITSIEGAEAIRPDARLAQAKALLKEALADTTEKEEAHVLS